MTGMRAVRAREAGQVAVLAKSVSVFTLLSLLVTLLGFGLLGMTGHSFSTTWVWLSTLVYAIALVLNLFLVVPALQSAAEEITATAGTATAGTATAGTVAVAKVASYSRIAAGSGIVSLLLVTVTVLMVWRP